MFDYDLALSSDDEQHIFDTKPEPVIKKRRRYDQFRQVNNIGINQDEESKQSSYLTSDEEGVPHLDVDEPLIDDIKQVLNKDDDTPVEQYTPFDHDDIDTNSDLEYPEMNIKFDELWILLWIFKYQERF